MVYDGNLVCLMGNSPSRSLNKVKTCFIKRSYVATRKLGKVFGLGYFSKLLLSFLMPEKLWAWELSAN